MRPRAGINHIRPYQGGKPIEEVQRELGIDDVIKLASNENPLGPSKEAARAIADAALNTHYYPDGNAFYLKHELAAHLGVLPEQLILGNGSNEVLQLLGETFLNPGDHVVYAEQAFVVYDLVSTLFEATVSTPPLKNDTYDLDALAEVVTPNTKLVFIANPNNPTGTYNTKAELDRFFEKIPTEPLVVLDEAYFEYVQADDYPNGLDYLRAGRNVLVTRTFSKIYGLAGVRLGYGIGSPGTLELMNRARQPFNVNSIAQAAGRAAIKDESHVHRSREVNAAGLSYLTAELDAMGLTYVPSVANFLLAHLDRDGAAVSNALMKRGVIVRPVANYGYAQSMRVTVGLPEQNERFICALREACDEIPVSPLRSSTS
ncbi:MAG: histidinol-phosphate transaminase [Candidatus Poribacteria bacterium]|nr:histidinol-phosphate transaminase [Candidatus Poribacteria bacterium]